MLCQFLCLEVIVTQLILSARRIAGIVSEAGNVLGMMPHPERISEAAHGGLDGRRLFEGLVEAIA